MCIPASPPGGWQRNWEVGEHMKWELKKKRRPLYFADAARFNWAMDTNAELRDGLSRLAEQYPTMTEREYTRKMLALFQRAGLTLSDEDLMMLLTLRQKTDQMLLERKESGADERTKS